MDSKLLIILSRISEIIASGKEYEKALDEIVELLAENLDVDVCSVYAYEEKENALILAATCGLKKSSVGEVRMAPGEGLTGTSFSTRTVINTASPEKRPEFKYFPDTGEKKFKSFLAAPLLVGGKCFGVLTIQKVENRKFPAPVLEMVKTLATQLANLVLNSKMLQDLSIESKNGKNSTASIRKEGQIVLRGTAANSGIACGKAFIFESRDFFQTISHQVHSDGTRELQILDKAVELAKQKTMELEDRALKMISEADASIFYTHLLFLEDPSLISRIKSEITDNNHSAEFGIKIVFQDYQKKFRHLGDETFRDKVMDLKDVLLRLIEAIRNVRLGHSESKKDFYLKSGQILFASEILPSDLLRLPTENISGIVCEKGGITAHVAILARALNIPALMGVKDVIKQLNNDDNVILDCHAEIVYVRPGRNISSHFGDNVKFDAERLHSLESLPSVTLDKKKIILRGNISLICETSLLKDYGASGIGLYRSEFLFMIRDRVPSEEEQFRVFSRIIREAGNGDVAIRVLDIGGDKPLPYLNFPNEDNPALGVRGIRLLLSRPDILKTQLKAILRAGVDGKLRIIFPIVSDITDLFEIKALIKEVKAELDEDSIKYAKDAKTGIMLEVPSLLFSLDEVIENVDFISIGTNDLLQYTFAADRSSEDLAYKYNCLHPVFLKIIKNIAAAFAKYPEKHLSVCGEMAGNPEAVPLLIGAGINELSMTPRQIPIIKSVLRKYSVPECEKLLGKALTYKNAEDVTMLLKESLASKGLAD